MVLYPQQMSLRHTRVRQGTVDVALVEAADIELSLAVADDCKFGGLLPALRAARLPIIAALRSG